MNIKKIGLLYVFGLVFLSGCFNKEEKLLTKESKEVDKVVIDEQEELKKRLLEEKAKIQDHKRGQGHMYKELNKKEFFTVEQRKEMFKDLGVEYVDHTIIGYSPLFKMDMKNADRYQNAPYVCDALTEQYGKYVENRYLAPISLRWLGDEVGYGVFALEDIQNEGFIGIYTGEAVAREPYLSVDYAWAYPMTTLEGGKIILDAKFKGNEMRFVNDSRNPNCVVKYILGFDGIWHVCYVASAFIKKGEQILVSYGEGYWKSRQYKYKEMNGKNNFFKIKRTLDMDILYAPWRDKYVTSNKLKDKSNSDCVFCDIINDPENDEKYFVLKRTENTITLMNLFPYNSGHLLIMPIAHVSTLALVESRTAAEIFHIAGSAEKITARAIGAQGANVGINIGSVAGAGIPQHVHIHFVPRWAGDTNFLPILAGTKQISVDLQRIYEKLKIEFDELKI